MTAMRNIFSGPKYLLVMLCGLGLLAASDSSHPLVGSSIASAQEPTKDSAPQKALMPLITVDDLVKLIESKPTGLKILEPGTNLQVYRQGHLPTAQFLHWVDDMTDPAAKSQYNNPREKQFVQLMSRLGIENGDRVVIYDRLASRLSTRLFWTFKTYGHNQVQVLDGGFNAGKAKIELTENTTVVAPSQYQITNPKSDMIADMDLVREKLDDPNCRLIDGRPEEQFSGEQPGAVFHTGKQHSRIGHIPGAKNVFWKDNFNPDGTFKSAAELKTLYREAGILPKHDVITYCNEGLHAAPPWFILTELLDYKKVQLYDSSMAEWAESEQPMATVPAGK